VRNNRYSDRKVIKYTVDFIPIRLELPEFRVLEALPYEKLSNNLLVNYQSNIEILFNEFIVHRSSFTKPIKI